MRKKKNRIRRAAPATRIMGLSNIGRMIFNGCVGLLGILGLALVFPVVNQESFASCTDGTEAEGCVASYARADISMTANTVISLAMESQVSLDVKPKSSGAVAESSAKVRVATNSSEGYAIYLSAGNEDGSLRPITSNIDGEITNTTKTNVTLDGLETNSYGYTLSTTPANDTTTYSGVPVTGEIIKSTNKVTAGSGEYAYGDEYYLSFGTKIGTSLPAGTYTGSVLLSVVANPTTLRSLYDLTYMQEMTPELCEATGEHYTKQLIDTRDGKSYWVAKLKDGNCWMTQNLALDLGTGSDPSLKYVSKLTPADSDVSEEWTAPTSDGELFLQFGKVVLATPLLGEACTVREGHDFVGDTIDAAALLGENLGANCRSVGFVDVSDSEWNGDFIAKSGVFNGKEQALVAVDENAKTYDAHYLVGNYYFSREIIFYKQINASTHELLGSICPKGWELPSGAVNGVIPLPVAGKPSFYGLMKSYGYPDSANYSGSRTDILFPRDNVAQNLAAGPVHLVRGGAFDNDYQALANSGMMGEYLSIGDRTAFALILQDSKIAPSVSLMYSVDTQSVRCVAK